MDRIMVFGFLSGFVTLVLLSYRNELKTRLPVIPIALACCSVYGFLQGAWPLGFCLIAITAIEIRQWLKTISVIRTPTVRFDFDAPTMPLEIESRITRLFGRT